MTHLAKIMDPKLTLDDAAKAVHSWAQEHIPAIYQLPQENLVITLLRTPEFGVDRESGFI